MKLLRWILDEKPAQDSINMIARHAHESGFDNELVNIRLLFSNQDPVLKSRDKQYFVPLGSTSARHIYQVLFADAVRWWSSAHRAGKNDIKYLQSTMYHGKYEGLYNHFYRGFRNNQLSHFPGGEDSNEIVWFIPESYEYDLTVAEYEKFASLLKFSLKLACIEPEELVTRFGGDVDKGTFEDLISFGKADPEQESSPEPNVGE